MNSVVFFRINADLRDGHSSSKKRMICEENIIEINLTCLFVTDKVAISVVYTIKEKAGKIHCNKVKVHALYTENIMLFTSLLCNSYRFAHRMILTRRKNISILQCQLLFVESSLLHSTFFLNDRIIIYHTNQKIFTIY